MESAHTMPASEFFTDRRVRAVYESFATGRAWNVIQLQADRYDGRTVGFGDERLVNFSTCNYLGLEKDPRLIAGIKAEADRTGAAFTVSRAYASSTPHRRFQEQLAVLFGVPAIVAPSCTLGHFAFVTTMIQARDVLILDSQVHNSVQMAATASFGARTVRTPHNDLDRLEALVQRLVEDPKVNHVWYFGDGIYSMFGDVAPVERLVELMDRYEPFYIYLDDAHGTSTQGRHGRGYVLDRMGTLHPKAVVTASLSKGFGINCGSALLVANDAWRDVIQTCGATMIFSSPIPPPMLGAGIAAADIHLSDEMDGMMAEVRERIAAFQKAARAHGLALTSDVRSPVQYVVVGELEAAMAAVRRLFEAGYWVNVCGFPAVPKDRCGVRVTMSRHVSLEDVRGLAASIAEAIEAVAPEALV